MPVSAAERMRKYRERIRNDPQKREEVLSRDRAIWRERRVKGKVKVIDDMTDREKRRQRKYWRNAWKRSTERTKNKKETAELLQNMADPCQRTQQHTPVSNNNSPDPSAVSMTPNIPTSSAKTRGRKNQKRQSCSLQGAV